SELDDQQADGTWLHNALLEEYVDCLHFFLSIARQLGLPPSDLCSYEDSLEGGTELVFSELLLNVGYIIGDEMGISAAKKDTKTWK
ncbi:dUTP diphosphatase, partial [Paenibacillus antibioticophila]|uniref:dUTP diphosphatase n=1 Tax=Paenibacillus antibioticophila TaxID=1274374 RepID=UPI001BB460CF